MYFILQFAAYVLVFCFVNSIITRIFNGVEAGRERDSYLHIHDGQTKSIRYIIFTAFVYLAVFLLSFIFVPLAVLLPFLNFVYLVLAWVWLIETYNSGKIAIWYNDVKEYFNKK